MDLEAVLRVLGGVRERRFGHQHEERSGMV